MAELNDRALATLEDYAEYGNAEEALLDNADLLFRLLNAASDAFYRATGYREFKALRPNPDTRTYRTGVGYRGSMLGGWERRSQFLPIDDASAITAVRIGGTLVDPAGYRTEPENPFVIRPIEALVFDPPVLGLGYVVEVDGTFGWPVVPDDVVQAVLVTVEYWNARDVQRFSSSFETASGDVRSSPRELPAQAFDTARGYQRKSIGP